MKKILSFCLVLILLFTVVGCGKGKDPYKGTYNAVGQEQLDEINNNLIDWFDESWDTYKGSIKSVTTIGLDGDSYSVTMKGDLYMHTIVGEELMYGSMSGGGMKSTQYIKDGVIYINATAYSQTTRYSIPYDLSEIYEYYGDDAEGLSDIIDVAFNLKRILSGLDVGNLTLDEVFATAESGEMKIKIVIPDFKLDFGYGIDFDYQINLQLFLLINEENCLEGVRIITKEDMSMMFEGDAIMDMSKTTEVTINPFNGTIPMPNDLNEYNYPSLF